MQCLKMLLCHNVVSFWYSAFLIMNKGDFPHIESRPNTIFLKNQNLINEKCKGKPLNKKDKEKKTKNENTNLRLDNKFTSAGQINIKSWHCVIVRVGSCVPAAYSKACLWSHQQRRRSLLCTHTFFNRVHTTQLTFFGHACQHTPDFPAVPWPDWVAQRRGFGKDATDTRALVGATTSSHSLSWHFCPVLVGGNKKVKIRILLGENAPLRPFS